VHLDVALARLHRAVAAASATAPHLAMNEDELVHELTLA